MGHALAHLDHRERRARSRLDYFEQRRIPELDAIGLESDLNDRLSDIVTDGGFRCAGKQESGRYHA
jgi:hypothetical protein